MTLFLHVVTVRDMANRNHGTYKDMLSRVDWLRNRFPGYRQLLIEDDDPAVIDQIPGDEPLEGVLVEYSYHSRIVRRIGERWPEAPLAVRCINLEPLQHFDNHGWWPPRGPLWMLYGMARLAWKDVQTKRFADELLCINDWEIARYWRWLPGRAKSVWLPYLCPKHLIPQDPIPYHKRRIMACLPTSQKNRKSLDLVMRFLAIARAWKSQGLDADFVVTGDLGSWGLPECPEVTFTGMIDDLAGFLGTCRAVCLLSPLGYGFKTTIGDALAAGAHVIAHPTLIRRSPARLRSCLISAVDPRMAERLKKTPVMSALTCRMQEEFNQVMCEVFDINAGAHGDYAHE